MPRTSAALAVAMVFALGGCTTHSASNHGAGGAAGAALKQLLIIEPTTLDPANVPDVTTSAVVMHTFEGLTAFNEKNEIVPALAERWDISKDGKTYTFHLRKGVKFQNGRELNASDVKYSWERALNPATASAQASNYLEGILGTEDVASGKSKALPGVTVIDALTLKVEMDRPRAYFTGMLSMPQDFVVCKEAVEKTGGKVTDQSYIGTGPYRLESYQPGRQMNFTAFDDYWGGKPTCPRIEMPVILNPKTSYDNFVTGQLDVYPDMPVLQYAQDRDKGALQAEYKVSPEAAFDYIGLQETRQPAFKNPDVRRALALAIDRDELFKVAFKSVGKIATGVLPEGMPLTGPLPPQIKYDPAAAKQLLAKAGYPGGKGFPPLTLSYIQESPVRESVAVIVRRNLHDNLGIEVSLSTREANEFYNAEQKHGQEMWFGGWVADYLDPQDFLSTLFVTGKPMNFFDYSNKRFDALCAEADAGLDPSRRSLLYGEAHEMLMNDMPVIPLLFPQRVSLVHTNITGWRDCLLYTLPNNHTIKN